MSRRKTKYTLRADGKTIELTKVIDGKRKHFYGKTDAEVEGKLAEYLDSLKSPKKAVRSFEDVADEWWEQKEPEISPSPPSENPVKSMQSVEITGFLLFCFGLLWHVLKHRMS